MAGADAISIPSRPGAALDVPAHVDPARVVDIDIYALPGQEADFHAAWKALQEASPELVWTPRNEGHWIALRGDLVAEVQADHARFSNRVIVVPKSVGEQHKLIPTTYDPPEHRPYRKLLNEGLSLSRLRGMREAVQATAIELIEGFLAKGRCDFTAEYAQVFPIRLFLAMVDLPMSDAAQIRYWAECMTRPNPPMPFGDAKAAFAAYLEPILAARRAVPGEDLLSRMMLADMGDGRRLGEEEAVSLATQVLIAGVDTVVNILGFVMRHLATHPQDCATLAAATPQQVLFATHELFRRFGLVTIARTVREDMEFHGCQLKAGELVSIPTQLHGLDARLNMDPLTVDLQRRDGRHSAFGSGPHMCPGQELARAEVAITITEWLKRIPDFRLAPDADVRCSGGLVAQVNRVVLEWDA